MIKSLKWAIKHLYATLLKNAISAKKTTICKNLLRGWEGEYSLQEWILKLRYRGFRPRTLKRYPPFMLTSISTLNMAPTNAIFGDIWPFMAVLSGPT